MLKNDAHYIRLAWIWIIGFALFRFIFSGTFLLAPDEANYWQWGRHLAWGYHDQAPMIGWMIRLSTLVFGNTEMGVRFPSVLTMAVASAYLIAIANRWFNPRVVLGTVILSQSVVEFNIGGLLATPDSLQAAAWAASSYHIARAFEDDTWRQWLMSGLWFGFGMLSKYTMVIFLPCVLLYGLFSKTHRQRLTSIRPYCGLVLGTALFSPVIFWNALNNWNSFRHVAFIGGANEAFALRWNFLGDYLASQAGLLSPLVFLLVLLAWWLSLNHRYTSGQWIYLFLFFTSFPMFAGFSGLSLHSRVYGNWPGAGFLTATILVTAFFSTKTSAGNNSLLLRPGKKLWLWTIGTSYLITVLVLIQVVWPILPFPTELDRTSTELQGWKLLGEKVNNLKQQMPRPNKTFLFGFRYQTASELAFYAPSKPETVSINKWKRPNVYDYWITDEDLLEWDAVGVALEDPQLHLNRLKKIFNRVDSPEALQIFRKSIWKKNQSESEAINTFYIYRAYGFKGGLRWEPKDPRDIRALFK